MPRLDRRHFLGIGVAGLTAHTVAGCLSDTGEQTDATTTETREPTATQTTRTEPSWGPWEVALANELDDEYTVAVEVRSESGEVVRNETYSLEPDDGISPITIAKSGEYTAKVSTEFGTETVDFTACRLNSDLQVTLHSSEEGPKLTVHQRHQDPGTEMANRDDIYECDE